MSSRSLQSLSNGAPPPAHSSTHQQQAAPAAVKILGGDCGPDIEKLNLILIATIWAHTLGYIFMRRNIFFLSFSMHINLHFHRIFCLNI